MKPNISTVQTGKFLAIATRVKDTVGFKIFTDEKLQKIADRMVEVDRATLSFGRSKSQFTAKAMTLSMLANAPYRVLRQCLAEIEKKRGAIKETIFLMRKKEVRLRRLEYQIVHLKLKVEGSDAALRDETFFDIELFQIEKEETATQITDSMLYIEGALKEIAIYQEVYLQVKKNKNIPDNWNEVDFENEESEHHIKQAFRQACRDFLISGRIGVGNQEYLEQMGINPIKAQNLIYEYFKEMADNADVSIKNLEDFLSAMVLRFKSSFASVMNLKGINPEVEEWCAYTGQGGV